MKDLLDKVDRIEQVLGQFSALLKVSASDAFLSQSVTNQVDYIKSCQSLLISLVDRLADLPNEHTDTITAITTRLSALLGVAGTPAFTDYNGIIKSNYLWSCDCMVDELETLFKHSKRSLLEGGEV